MHLNLREFSSIQDEAWDKLWDFSTVVYPSYLMATLLRFLEVKGSFWHLATFVQMSFVPIDSEVVVLNVRSSRYVISSSIKKEMR